MNSATLLIGTSTPKKKAAKGRSRYCEHLFAASLSSFHEVLLKTSRRSGEFQKHLREAGRMLAQR